MGEVEGEGGVSSRGVFRVQQAAPLLYVCYVDLRVLHTTLLLNVLYVFRVLGPILRVGFDILTNGEQLFFRAGDGVIETAVPFEVVKARFAALPGHG